MGECIVYDDAIKALVKRNMFDITAKHGHILLREFFLGDAHHLRGDVHGGDGSHAPAQIVGNQHASAAGHIQHPCAGFDACAVQDFGDDGIIANHIRIPMGSHMVKKRNDIVFVHAAFSLE